MGKLHFSFWSASGIFFSCVWREREPLVRLTAWSWPGLRPSLVYPAGCFPEQPAQGRGTCCSPKHWWRVGPKRRGEGSKDGKTFGSSRKTDMCRIIKRSGRTERCSSKKTFVYGSVGMREAEEETIEGN